MLLEQYVFMYLFHRSTDLTNKCFFMTKLYDVHFLLYNEKTTVYYELNLNDSNDVQK